jgi:NADP-dependent 3-hydroxy acid dehydrogenase YdfG
MSVFNGQVAVVTGASSGIGRAIAFDLAAHGATLCLIGRNRTALSNLINTAGGAETDALCCLADLTIDKQNDEAVEQIRRRYGRVDVLVHSAGVISWGHIEASGVADLDRQFWTNVRAPYVLTRALLPMLRVGPGQVVFLNSSLGLSARENVGQYAATKHALRALADSLRADVNADGIRVLSVFLGRTASPMQEAAHAIEGRLYRPERLLQPQDVASVVTHTLSLPSTAEVTDVSIRPMLKPMS